VDPCRPDHLPHSEDELRKPGPGPSDVDRRSVGADVHLRSGLKEGEFKPILGLIHAIFEFPEGLGVLSIWIPALFEQVELGLGTLVDDGGDEVAADGFVHQVQV
jgi:hypothetical protein